MKLPIRSADGSACPLDAYRAPKGLRVTVLGPHPDDFDCIAVTLRHLHHHGAQLHVAVLSSGISGVEDADAVPPTGERKRALRQAEQIESCRRFGLPRDALQFLPLAEDDAGEPADHPENLKRVTDFLMATRPDIVFLPHGHDQKGGHRNVYALFRAAAATLRQPLVALLNRDPKTIDLRIDAYMPYAENDAAWKAELLRCHATQQRRNVRSRGTGFDERILGMDRKSAAELKIAPPYAEAFELERYN